jgi:hypothetical protein
MKITLGMIFNFLSITLGITLAITLREIAWLIMALGNLECIVHRLHIEKLTNGGEDE